MYPYNPFPSDPMFSAQMPDAYNNPLNFGAYGINPAQAGWNINSAYMTPSFMAGYRPGYMGHQNFRTPPMGFGRSALTAIPTPFQPEAPVYADPLQYRYGAVSSMVNTPMDMAMGGAQIVGSVAIGLAMQGAVDSLRIPFGAQPHYASISEAYRAGAPRWLGGSPTRDHARYMARSQTLFEAGGHYLGKAAGRGVGHGVSGLVRAGSLGMVPGVPGLGKMMGTAGSFAGAAAGSLLGAFAFGTAAMEVANQAFFTPYASGRQSADVLQESLAGTYTGLGQASAPLNVSNVNAGRIGFATARSFSDDFTFDQSSAAPMLGYGMQAGLFRGTNLNERAIVERTRSMAQGVKLMMEVFNDPSIQDAIQRLGNLALTGGVTSTAGLSALGQKYRAASALSGIGSRELMDTYGNQGQFMYGQAGLVPYLGQFAAMNAASGFSVAQRLGLVTAPSLAAMGGIGGAVQSSLSAQLGLARTPYNAISAFNSEYLGRGSGSITGNLANFGNYMASNPLSAYGNFLLNRNESISAQISKNPGAILDQVFQQAALHPGAMKGGKIDAGSFAAILESMGVGPEESRALLIQLKSLKDPRTQVMANEANKAALNSSYAAMLERSSLTHYGHGFMNLGSVPYALRSAKNAVQSGASEFWQPFNWAGAKIADDLSSMMFGMSNNVDLASSTSGMNFGGLTAEQWNSPISFSMASNKFDATRRARMVMGDKFKNLPTAMQNSTRMVSMPKEVGSRLNMLQRLASNDTALSDSLRRISGSETISNSDLAQVMRVTGSSRAEALDLMSYYATQDMSSRTTSSVRPFDALVGDARDYFQKNLSLHLEGHSGLGAISTKVGSLSADDLSAIATFVSENGAALDNNDSFLQALTTPGNGSERIAGILSKLGLSSVLTGGSEAELGVARKVMTAALGTYTSDPSFRKLGVAGSLLRGDKEQITKKGLMKALVKASGAVDVSSPGRKAAVKPSVNELISGASAMNSAINDAMAAGGSMAKHAKNTDFSGLAEASEKQQKAGELQLEAASIFERAVYNWLTPGSRSQQTWMGINPDGSTKNTTEQFDMTLFVPIKGPR